MKTKLVALLLIACLLGLIGCSKSSTKPQNEPPVIIGLIAEPDTIGTSQKAILTCFADDPDEDSLSYIWEVIAGSISGTGPTVEWTPPDTTGTFSIICIVDDGNEGQDTDDVSIHVIKVLYRVTKILDYNASIIPELQVYRDSFRYNAKNNRIRNEIFDANDEFIGLELYEYNEEYFLTKRSNFIPSDSIHTLNWYRTNYQYDENEPTRCDIFDNSGEQIGYLIWEYDNNGMWMKLEEYSVNDSLLNYWGNFEYDENGVFSKWYWFDSNNNLIRYR
ncbi:MAG: hypothetical protein KAW87_03245, partial [Candidatus Cloacimonetes bacterium]|nr:hypothetical protein [Candidatus Cloacimonadota bacterium]